MKGPFKIHVLRKPGAGVNSSMLTIEVTRLPCVGEIVHVEDATPSHYRVLQVAHTPGSPQVHGEVWTEPFTDPLGLVWRN